MSWGQRARALGEALLDLLAPRRCLGCDALDQPRDEAGFCDACGSAALLRDVSLHLGRERVPVFAGVRYAEPTVSAIHRFKYGGSPELARELATLVVPGIDLLGIEPGAVWVPVPLHPLRLAERGYNQAALLARELARVAHGKLDPLRLRRARHTEQQAKRDRNDRNPNVAGAFIAAPRARAAAGLVLVDDVVTSGATLAACIDALHASGERVVGCLAVAFASSVGGEFVAVPGANESIIEHAGPRSPDWSNPHKNDSTGSHPTESAARAASKSSAAR
jgi:ComF family protein